MSEEEYQFALRELPPCKLIQIINKYRDKIHELVGKQYISNIDDLRQIIPEWYEKN